MKKIPFEERLNEAADIIAKSNHLVVFTGAGISTESGIPDYRGPDGVWTRQDKGLSAPKMRIPWDEIKPNSGHYAIVELQDKGMMKFLISQNVDGLHMDSGIDEDKIAEFHGNRNLMICIECGRKFIKKEIWDRKKWGQGWKTSRIRKTQPNCTDCGGRIANSIVNFGDIIPQKELELSYYHSSKADTFLVVGSLLAVVPAANMPMYALRNGAKLIIINNMETGYDHLATVLFRENTGEVLTGIIEQIKNITGK